MRLSLFFCLVLFVCILTYFKKKKRLIPLALESKRLRETLGLLAEVSFFLPRPPFLFLLFLLFQLNFLFSNFQKN